MASAAPKTPFDVRTRVNFGGLNQILGYQTFRVLLFMGNCKREGLEPSYDEICDGTGIGTKGEVSRIMRRLERRGLVVRPGCGGPKRERRARLTANL